MSKSENNGWICPKCDRVYAPWVSKCQYCGSSIITYTSLACPCLWQTSQCHTITKAVDNTVACTSATNINLSATNSEVKC